MEKNQKRKEYIFNFIEGGWNSEWAFNKKEAISLAKKRWGGKFIVDEKTFRIANPEEVKQLMSLFY